MAPAFCAMRIQPLLRVHIACEERHNCKGGMVLIPLEIIISDGFTLKMAVSPADEL